MPRRASAVFVATLLAGIAGTILRMPSGAVAASSPARQENPAAVAFERWLNAQAEQALAAGREARAAIRTADDVRRRADTVRRQVLDAMGGLPDLRAPLNARITGGFTRDGYRVDHLVFESLPGFFVTANLYVPTSGPGPFPAVLGTAGHSDVGKAADVYQHAWVGLARRGVMVLAYDPPGQGERLEYFDAASGTSRVGIGTREHTHAGQQCLLTGTSIARYFAWDGIRAFDYLLTRPDVDAARIGVAGNSGGGTQAAWLGVVESRLAAVDSSCYITSWPALWTGPGPQDMEQVLPGFLSRGLDFADLIAAAAPRPYLVSSAVRDFFPIEGARASVTEARTAYASLGAAERLAHVEHDAAHGWSQPLREAAYRWFGRWWLENAEMPDAGEGPVTVEPAERLRATPTGQVATSFQSRTMFDLNRDRARELARRRPTANAARVRALLRIPEAPVTLHVARRTPASEHGGLRAERLDIGAGSDMPVPALLIHPRGDRPQGSVVVADGREPGSDRLEIARRWTERGFLVLAMDVRGAGALGPTRGESGYSSDYQLAARAWLLGTSVVAWQTRDLLAGLAFLERELPAAPGGRVVHAAGITTPAGLFAASLHPVDAVWLEDGIVSYLDLASTRDYAASARLFVPGVLEVTDLPEVMSMAAPAAVHLVRPIRADGQPVRDDAELRGLFGGVVPGNVTVHFPDARGRSARAADAGRR